MLGDGGVEICGKIWFVSMTAQLGRELAPPSEDDGSMFDHIESLELGDIPAAVFNPTVAIPTVRIYPKCLSAEDNTALGDCGRRGPGYTARHASEINAGRVMLMRAAPFDLNHID